jgi:hypothetical protein
VVVVVVVVVRRFALEGAFMACNPHCNARKTTSPTRRGASSYNDAIVSEVGHLGVKCSGDKEERDREIGEGGGAVVRTTADGEGRFKCPQQRREEATIARELESNDEIVCVRACVCVCVCVNSNERADQCCRTHAQLHTHTHHSNKALPTRRSPHPNTDHATCAQTTDLGGMAIAP